jgi:hypothetical protein
MNVDEAIAAIRSKWTIPVSTVPELREILEALKGGPILCGKTTWPYTTNNICVLKSGHTGRHKDLKDRPFD